MGVASCLFVVHWAGTRPRWLDERLNKLVQFYEPLGARDPTTVDVGDTAVVGEVEFDSLDGGRGRGQDRTPISITWLAEWGGPLPLELRSPEKLLIATDDQLRSIRGTGAALAFDGEAMRLVTSPIGPTPLYVSAAHGLTVWSTHALAASWLARGTVELRGDALPEFVVCEFVGGERTHLEGVRAVPPCTRIEVTAGTYSEHDYWPLAHRWAGVAPGDAADVAEAALLASLDSRLRDCKEPFCGLTAGADSRVVALALRELLGGEFRAFTFGEKDWPDVTGAQAVARALEIPHVHCGLSWNSDDETRAAVETAVRWSDGLEPVNGFGSTDIPARPSAIVTGRGGETGRAFFYRFALGVGREPTRPDLVDAVIGYPPARLQGAAADAQETLRASVSRWLELAEPSGQRGWRLLDVAYGEQRLTRWDRTRLMRQESLYVPAFDDPDVQRALASLPLEERLTDGFHRRFVARRAPALVPPPPPRPQRGVPTPLRKAVRALRARRRPSEQWFLAHEWDRRPRTRQWVVDELLTHALLEQVFGDKWVRWLRAGFRNGDAMATETALVLVAPLALEREARSVLRSGDA